MQKNKFFNDKKQITTNSIEYNVSLGLEWLISSGIQAKKERDDAGGFSAWYDTENKKSSFTYSEITGYALNLLLAFKKKYPVKGLNESIDLATDYLTKRAFDERFGAVKCRYVPNDGWLENYCTFDNGIIANALINKYRYDKDTNALDVATVILDTLMNKLFYGKGFYSRYISKEKKYQNDPIKWSTGSGTFHAKVIIPFLNIYDLTKEKKYLEFAENVLELTLKQQQSSGRFITCTRSNSTFLHPMCYTLEGLLTASMYLKNKSCSRAVNNGLKWMSSLQLENGGIAGFVTDGSKISLDSPDINAQYLRCMVLSGFQKKNLVDASSLTDRILNQQVENPDEPRSNGGFRVGDIWFYDQITGEMSPIKEHINTCATIFAINAMYYLQFKDTNPFTLC
jgi:hypothetical protein